jgi:adenylate cyclase
MAAARGALSPASTTSNISMRDHRMSDHLTNYRRDLAVLETSGSRVPQIQNIPPTAGPMSQVAPWTAGNGSSTPGSGVPTSFYNDSSDNLSIASQLSPGFRSTTVRMGPPTSGSQESPDAAYFNDDRRPSLASITTASSQGSKGSVTRGGLRKLQGFFGEEFPGRDGSETSLPGTLGKERSQSYSHSRPSRDRNYSNATDHTREASPSSSRPRTPVPAPEVVPFLYQEADVRIYLFLLSPVLRANCDAGSTQPTLATPSTSASP